MNRWLVKTEPGDYAAQDLAREGRTAWTGVTNPVAQKHLRAMSSGDAVFIYHTGDEKAIVATGSVYSAPRTDPADKNGKLTVVDLAFDQWLKKPVTLAQVKADPAFAEFELVRISRLSVMPVSADDWDRLMKMAGGFADPRG